MEGTVPVPRTAPAPGIALYYLPGNYPCMEGCPGGGGGGIICSEP